jgi:hypothetical protein
MAVAGRLAVGLQRRQMASNHFVANGPLNERGGEQRQEKERMGVPQDQWEGPTQIAFVDLPEKIRYSDEQGVGKSPGYTWPWQRFWIGLVKQVYTNYSWPNPREVPSRMERQNNAGAYALMPMQANRHVWPGGGAGPNQSIIESPEAVPLTDLARRI